MAALNQRSTAWKQGKISQEQEYSDAIHGCEELNSPRSTDSTIAHKSTNLINGCYSSAIRNPAAALPLSEGARPTDSFCAYRQTCNMYFGFRQAQIIKNEQMRGISFRPKKLRILQKCNTLTIPQQYYSLRFHISSKRPRTQSHKLNANIFCHSHFCTVKHKYVLKQSVR